MFRSYASSSTEESSEDNSSSIIDFRAFRSALQSSLYDSLCSSGSDDNSEHSDGSLCEVEGERNRGFDSFMPTYSTRETHQHRRGKRISHPPREDRCKGEVFPSRPKKMKKKISSTEDRCSSSCSDGSAKCRVQACNDLSEVEKNRVGSRYPLSCNSTSASEFSSTSHSSFHADPVKRSLFRASSSLPSTASSDTDESGSSYSDRNNDQVVILSAVEQHLLEVVNKNMRFVARRLHALDAELQERMSKNQWERLYVFSNPSIQQNRKILYEELCRLYAMKKELLSGEFRKAILEKHEQEKRAEVLCSDNGVFTRLYNKRRMHTKEELNSVSVAKEPSRTGRNGRKDPANYGNVPLEEGTKNKKTCYDRLYSSGMALIKRRKEKEKTASLQHQQKEMQEYLEGFLTARLRAEDYGKEQREKCRGDNAKKVVNEIMKSGVESPEVIKAVLREKKSLSESEMTKKLHSLSKRRGLDRVALEAKKKEAELKGCTFRPNINPVSARMECNLPNELRLWREQKKKMLLSSVQKKKLDLLHARMREDHHFRVRVERDPRIGEEYMSGLCV